MSFVKFRYRRSKPSEPVPGSFYWVELDDDETHQIWFAPDTNPEHLILLNENVDLSSYVSEEVLAEVLADYAKTTDIPEITELTESDYDKIAEKVNEKTLHLTWQEI